MWITSECSLFQRLFSDRRNVDEFHRSKGRFLGRVERRQLLQPFIRHARHANVRLTWIRAPVLVNLGFRQDYRKHLAARRSSSREITHPYYWGFEFLPRFGRLSNPCGFGPRHQHHSRQSEQQNRLLHKLAAVVQLVEVRGGRVG